MIRFSSRSDKFTQMIAPLVVVADECRLSISPSGLAASVVDHANALIASVRLPKRIFDSYEVDECREVGVDIAMLSSIIENASDESEPIDISIFTDPAEARDYMRFSLGQSEYEFKLPGIESIRKPLKILPLTFATICHIPAAPVRKAIERAFKVGDRIQLSSFRELETNIFTMSTDMDEWGKLRTPFSDAGAISIHILKPSKSTLSLDYLIDVIKSCNSDTVRFKFGTNCPVHIEFDILGWGKATFLQAPRIEDY